LGTGWASFALLKHIKHEAFDVTCISPRNHLVFTPLLASTASGTLEFRSIAEPLKHAFPHVRYLNAECTGIDVNARKVQFRTVDEPQKSSADEHMHDGEVPFDLLVLGIGARNNTFGIPGVEENLYFLKELADARAIRQRVIRNVEAASRAGVSAADRRRLLSFVVCGGGPTGVEFSAELHDLLTQDVGRLYPELLPDISLTIIEGRELLGAFDQSLRCVSRSCVMADCNSDCGQRPKRLLQCSAKRARCSAGTQGRGASHPSAQLFRPPTRPRSLHLPLRELSLVHAESTPSESSAATGSACSPAATSSKLSGTACTSATGASSSTGWVSGTQGAYS
jgi:hypothetical protein